MVAAKPEVHRDHIVQFGQGSGSGRLLPRGRRPGQPKLGSRLIAGNPEWLQWQVIQNANTYEEGFTEAWDGIRHALWLDRSAENEAALEAFLQPDTVKAGYTTGHPDPSKISPDNWNMDLHFLARQQAHRVQLDLFYDYRTSAAQYDSWQHRCVSGSRGP